MKAPVGTTFVVAASLLGVAAVAQLVAVLIYFGPGFAVRPTTPPEAAPVPETAVEVAVTEPAVEEEKTPEADLDAAAQQERLVELMKEIELLEGGSSPAAALVPLEEALTLQPRNPDILARAASLHERLGQSEMAQSLWKNLLDLGPEAGRFLEVAEIRLRLLRQDNLVPSGSAALRDQVGLQPGSMLGVVDLKLNESDKGNVPVKDLRLAVKSRPGEKIDGRDVRINVTFYEKFEGEIVPTSSRVQSMWFTTPVDWLDDGIEILEVKYEVPMIGQDGGPPPTYYGYMVNIYYRGQLQETRADPVDLQDLFPPPLSELPGPQ
jgi:hypothetical protein